MPEPKESDLLVPFEIENIPVFYREYYSTKRNNFFASIQGFAPTWRCYLLLEELWQREFADLRPPGQLAQMFPLMLFFNAHSKMRISFELALSGCTTEARSILRDAVEAAAHAHTMLRDPELQKVWLNKNDEEEAFKNAFERQKREGMFKGLGELHHIWGELSEYGSHSTINSISDRLTVADREDGGQDWKFNYCGVEKRLWEVSLFSMILAHCAIQYVFFNDYEDRLKLDHILMEMRAKFETYKENLREAIKKRYGLKPPTSKPAWA